MQRSYKYRIYPNNSQRDALNNIFDFCRFIYNKALEKRINHYKNNNKSLSYPDQCKTLSEIVKLFPAETKTTYSQTSQQVLKQLDTAYKNFFNRIKKGSKEKGFPRFKNKDRFRSILFPQSDSTKGGIKLSNDNKYIEVFKVGNVKIKYHRPFQGRCKQIRITRNKLDQYFVIFSCINVPKNILPKTNKEIGIDLGINSFITTNNGISYHHPKPYKTSLEKMQFLQRKLQKCQKNSNNRIKIKKSLTKINNKIVNIREDFQYKLCNKLIKENDKIFIEDLNVKSMLESDNIQVKNSNISDAAFGSFKQKLIYKAESADKLVVLVGPHNTSKMCSNCGNIKKELLLKHRKYKCEACSFEMDRDQNAAINIFHQGYFLEKKSGIDSEKSKTPA